MARERRGSGSLETDLGRGIHPVPGSHPPGPSPICSGEDETDRVAGESDLETVAYTSSLSLVLLGFLLLAQEGEGNRLVERLGDPNPSVREEAARTLEAMGSRALPELKKAAASPDPEVRARSTALLTQIERELAQADREAQERPRVFPRVSVDQADVPLREVLDDLGRQAGIAWKTSDLLLDRPVTLKGKDLTLAEALDRLGLYRLGGHPYLHVQKPAKFAAFSDGLRFSFETRSFSRGGERLGTIFETRTSESYEGDLRWDVAAIRTDGARVVERCAIHSPELVYVAGAGLTDPRVTVKGLRRWYCPTPIEFSKPSNGDFWRVAPVQVSVAWPSIRVHTDALVEKEVLGKMLSTLDIKFKVKPGREKDLMGVGFGGGGGGRYGGRFGSRNPAELAWCGCFGRPAETPPNPPAMAQEQLVPVGGWSSDYRIEDIASISLILRKPVEEPFEVTSPPLKP